MWRTSVKLLAGATLLATLATGLLLASPAGPPRAETDVAAVRAAQDKPPQIPEAKDPAWDEGLADLLKKANLDHTVQLDAKKNRQYKVFYELEGETSTIWIQKGTWWAKFGGVKKEAIVLWTEVARLPADAKPTAALLTKIAEINTFFNSSFAMLGMARGTIYAQCGLFPHNLDHEVILHHVTVMHKLRVLHRKTLTPLLTAD